MTSLYTAIMRAADYIERNPKLHSFAHPSVPCAPTEQGCPLAWIGYFSQPEVTERHRYTRKAYTARDVAPLILGVSESQFFVRMDSLQRWFRLSGAWKGKYGVAVRCMRLYAKKYHGHEEPVTPPNWNAIASAQTVAADARSQELVS